MINKKHPSGCFLLFETLKFMSFFIFILYVKLSPMQLTKTNKIIISIVAIAVLFGAYILFDIKSKEQGTDTGTNQVSTTTDVVVGTNITGQGNYTIERVPINEGRVTQPVPDLNRVSVPAKGVVVSPEGKARTDAEIKSLQMVLKKDPTDFTSWLSLGLYQKLAGDYDGAVISWVYASKIAPGDYTSLGNLGDLYAYFIHDNGQAEVYYKEAIMRGPTQSYLYVQLAEVYQNVFKNLDKARAIVSQGLSKIPNDPNLLQLKASLNK
jgi:Tetratricopeptide repeat